MGLSRSLTTGTSSLRAHQARFDVISNNLANANTIGFKSSRANFSDQLSQVRRHGLSPSGASGTGTGGLNPMEFGLGVKLSSISKDMSQGVNEITNRPLDMALNGDGFFVYNMNNRTMYSRAGAINRDKQGYLVDNMSGAYLQGYNVQKDPDGLKVKDSNYNNILSRKVESIRIEPNIKSEPKQTTSIVMGGNLDKDSMNVGDKKTTSIKVFDNTGGARSINLTFEKADDTSFTLTADVDGNPLATSETVTFGSNGTLQNPFNLIISAADLNSALESDANPLFDTTRDIDVQLGDKNSLTSGSITNFTGASDITASSQNGYESGSLVGVNVGATGQILGQFTNGQSEVLGQVVVAKFINPEGMTKTGGNFFSTSANSGLPNIGTAGETFPSTTVQGESLEQSNVDLTEQFTEMISTQRAFEAASRTVTVSDQLLAETNQLKR